MSSPDTNARPRRRALLRFGVAAGLSLALAGCFRPVYGDQGYAMSPSQKGDAPVAVNLKRIDVKAIDGRVGGKMRNELIFLLRGGDAAGPVAYRLDVSLEENDQQPIVEVFSGQPEVKTVSLMASYELKPAGRLDPIIKGQEFATASYDYTLQRFANIRAERDAEDRAATQIAEKIRTRMQGYFASGR